MKLKVTHLTSAHSRYDTRIFLKECRSLTTNSFEVSLVVADGKEDEIKNGIKIYNVTEKLKNRFSRAFRSSFLAYKKAKELDSDIYHFHDPELIPYGLLLSLKGKKVVYDIHEDMAQQILIKSWIPVKVRKPTSLLFSKLESIACRQFYSLVVPQKEMEAQFSKYNKHTMTLYNFPNQLNYDVSFESKNKFQLIYAGSISEERGVFNLLNLMVELNKIDSRYKLVLAGNISFSLMTKIKQHIGWTHVDYRGVLNTKDLYKLYEESAIGLILFNNVGQYHMSYALKLFEYMQNGLTVVMPNFGSWLGFNEINNVGFCVDVEDSKTTSQLISNMDNNELEAFCKNNQSVCSDKFTWESQVYKFDKIYNH